MSSIVLTELLQEASSLQRQGRTVQDGVGVLKCNKQSGEVIVVQTMKDECIFGGGGLSRLWDYVSGSRVEKKKKK